MTNTCLLHEQLWNLYVSVYVLVSMCVEVRGHSLGDTHLAFIA